MCGVIGVFSSGADCAELLYNGLSLLQHRGQDAAGIATVAGQRLCMRKSPGLVRDVFDQTHIDSLKGNIGIGHVRYPTAGACDPAENQPLYVNSPYGIVMCHNGNLTNVAQLQQTVLASDFRHIHTTSDSEVLLNVLACKLHERIAAAGTSNGFRSEMLLDALGDVVHLCQGGYAAAGMIIGHGLFAMRDPCGIRPAILGQRGNGKTDYMIASESVALEAQGFKIVRDLRPGEAIFIDTDGKLHSRLCSEPTQYAPCIFEFVYMARPDSVIDGISVYKARLRMGEKLAKKILRTWPEHDIDVVIPVPDTSRTAALEAAHHLQVKYREGLIKNRYIDRTFIMAGQKLRTQSVRRKLNPINVEFKDKNVLLIDDSIVRGTTAQQIVQMARDAGAKKVYLGSASPPIKYPNVYGIDIPLFEELAAHDRTEQAICQLIGADRLIYQDLPDLIDSLKYDKSQTHAYETCCFDGRYIAGNPGDVYLKQQAQQRLAKPPTPSRSAGSINL